MGYPDSTNNFSYRSIEAMRELIMANSPYTKIVYCLPWAFEDGMLWAEGWTDDYAAMQKKIYDNTLEFADDLGYVISPVGWAWNTVLKERNYPLHYLHRDDMNHPSLYGSYILACSIFSTIYQERALGIDYYADIPEEDAKYFQEVSSNTVLNDLELWRIK